MGCDSKEVNLNIECCSIDNKSVFTLNKQHIYENGVIYADVVGAEWSSDSYTFKITGTRISDNKFIDGQEFTMFFSKNDIIIM